ncbi:hypothetical protein JCM9140_1037 [Halalkalibacter wakoensis JCM 9140]|uniref:Amidohydrolase-related domain-containing protein n=1 Tax=Halalkalibacter wakoensis JCM 9140 TaxID=1236970 RepID=W4PZ99_9BACI|nr:hypothetical protein [Halalkalibacter wakoensis]GAE25067.1 hypothetical protein JCM9140_1037 [Halalkalibacter wakoensis JCM 9140]
MYLLDKVVKVDEEKDKIRSYLINEGQIQYVTTAFEKWNKQRVNMSGTIMTNGRIMFDEHLLTSQDFQAFQDRQSHLIEKGCTAVAVSQKVQYEREIDSDFKRAKHAMANSTLDYLVGLTLPISLLRPAVLRKCQNLRIPFVRIEIESFQQIRSVPWTHISQTLLTYPTVLIPVISSSVLRLEAALLKEWENHCMDFQIHTHNPLTAMEKWEKPLLQKVGLYPLKGMMLAGSDVDYLLFYEDAGDHLYDLDQKVAHKQRISYDKKDPAIVVIKGEIVKANESISLKPGYGRLIEVKKPARFLSLSHFSDMMPQQQINAF